MMIGLPAFYAHPAAFMAYGLGAILLVGLARLPGDRPARYGRGLLLLSIVAALAALKPAGAPEGALLRQDGFAVLWQAIFLLA
ncbi:MAG: hypothetical protein NTX64_16385, partial [Elusimicrobia bacterium]|nr:hypothetical protein [Elusimicrobiota bacterium]